MDGCLVRNGVVRVAGCSINEFGSLPRIPTMCLPLINLINNFEPFSVRIITNHFVVFMIMRLSIHHAAAGVHHGNNSNEPTTEILGGPELFIDQGSTINLTCLVQFAPEPPPTVGWTHEKQPINFDSPRGGISLVTEKGSTTSSRLLIQKASSSDTGYYSCDPSNANSATVRATVNNELRPEEEWFAL
ncbi:hypothetical protein QTP88_011782 [Uroleucon formosanum]